MEDDNESRRAVSVLIPLDHKGVAEHDVIGILI